MESNQKARSNPRALHTLDGYKRGLVNSLTANLQWFGFEKIAKVQTLQELLVSTLAQADALAKLLIEKGLINEAEFS